MKKLLLLILLLALPLLFLSPLSAMAVDMNVTFGWNANPEADLAGYKIFTAQTIDGQKTEILDLAVPNLQGIVTLPEGTYWFFLAAYDQGGHLSGYTAPIEQKLDAPPSTPTGFVIIKIEIAVPVPQ